MDDKTALEVTSDTATLCSIIQAMVEALSNGPRSRERSLAITKLEEADSWLVKASSKEE